ncbi:MAG: hypothetical protein JO043_06260 [Candidatus Eremiobacteraeota bacterium]|nr:hypothetical protein [Candidatus Eremiobacteraeota bacterium]
MKDPNEGFRVFMLAIAASMGYALWVSLAGAEAAVNAPDRQLDATYERTKSFGHLYVLDVYYLAVYRFPIRFDGLPASRPDGTLYLEGAQQPTGLAVDRTGHVFVADWKAWGVAKFAVGATGHRSPISTLAPKLCVPDYLKVDDPGRLYVHCNGDQTVRIFAKGARGNDPPLNVIPPYFQNEFVSDYTVSDAGTLYKLDYAGPVEVYKHPLRHPPQVDFFLKPQDGYEFNFYQVLALDQLTDHLYIEFYTRAESPWNKVNYAARALGEPRDPTPLDPLIFTGDCGSMQWNGVGGIVVSGQYLIVSCSSSGDVLAYRKDRFGRQHAVEKVISNIYPGEIAIGP